MLLCQNPHHDPICALLVTVHSVAEVISRGTSAQRSVLSRSVNRQGQCSVPRARAGSPVAVALRFTPAPDPRRRSHTTIDQLQHNIAVLSPTRPVASAIVQPATPASSPSLGSAATTATVASAYRTGRNLTSPAIHVYGHFDGHRTSSGTNAHRKVCVVVLRGTASPLVAV